MCEKMRKNRIVQNGESLDFVHTHTHTSKSCQEIFARMRKLTTVLINDSLIVLRFE